MMKRTLAVILLSIGLLSIAISPVALTGCAGTKAQQVAYMTTDTLGSAVDKAQHAFNVYEALKAKAAIGPTANADNMLAWMKSDPIWKHEADLHGKYRAAYGAWCSANALVSTGTNVTSTVAAAQFQTAAIGAAVDLTTFIAEFVPTVKPLK